MSSKLKLGRLSLMRRLKITELFKIKSQDNVFLKFCQYNFITL